MNQINYNMQEINGTNKKYIERNDNNMTVDKKKKWMRVIAIIITIAFLATFLAYLPF